NASLEHVLNEIQKESQFELSYNAKTVREADNKITLDIRNVPLKVALERTLKGSQLHFVIQENTVFVKPISKRQMAATNTVRSTAAQQPLPAKVTDEQAFPVADVSVRAKVSFFATSTDSHGYYVLVVPAVVYSFV